MKKRPYKFSKRSLSHLNNLHQDLQRILLEAIKLFDFSIISSYRGAKEQDTYFYAGKSKHKYPGSKHNRLPSFAADLTPCPLDWNKRGQFLLLAGVVIAVARRLKDDDIITHEIRIGADWNLNDDPDDEKFSDLGHIEIIE